MKASGRKLSRKSKSVKVEGDNSDEENEMDVKYNVWVTKWVNYSEKYGIGYILSNGSIGVYFNDLTKLVLDPNNYHVDYFELDE